MLLEQKVLEQKLEELTVPGSLSVAIGKSKHVVEDAGLGVHRSEKQKRKH